MNGAAVVANMPATQQKFLYIFPIPVTPVTVTYSRPSLARLDNMKGTIQVWTRMRVLQVWQIGSKRP